MQLTKALGFAGALILSAVIGGALIGSALATEDPLETDATATDSEYCDAFMDALASELGVSRDDLVTAGRTAAGAAIDAAVAAGDLSEERAADLRERVDEHDGSQCSWLGRGFARGFGHGLARGFLGGDVFEAAADALGIESSELIGDLREAESLEALAEERGIAYDEVKSAILAAVEADLDAAVTEGLDQERADAVVQRLARWLDDGGRLEGFGHGPFGRHDQGRFPGPFGHHHSDDTDAEESGT